MLSVYLKEVASFLSSLTGYIVIAVFLCLLGLIMWVFPDYSILYYPYATLEQLFAMAPIVFLFLVPAITMKSFAEEWQTGTIEFLHTKPLREYEIILGKYFASLTLVILALLPTLLFYYSVYELGSPKGNIDYGAVIGSYLGLVLLACAFVAIGIFSSALTNNQVVSFLLGAFLSYLFYWGIYFLSKLPAFVGRLDDIIQRLGLDHHYLAISKGIVDTRNVIYFLVFSSIFLVLTSLVIIKRKG